METSGQLVIRYKYTYKEFNRISIMFISREVERAHHTGKPGGDRSRPIGVKFLTYKDKSTIPQRTKVMKGSNIYINEDFTDTEGKGRN